MLLDNVRSLHNVGAMFRSADAAGVAELILCGITGRPPRPEIEKTALGATETVPWRYEKDALAAICQLKAAGVTIVALEHTAESRPFWSVAYPTPVCLVVGNEVWGVQESLLEAVDLAVEIPMLGAKHSLNAGVAFGVAVYELVAQIRGGRPPAPESGKRQ